MHLPPASRLRLATLFALAVSAALPLAVQTSAVAQTAPAAARPAAKEDPVQLSAFEVTTSKDIGYQSTNAAEATRMNAPIENIPMNVAVFNLAWLLDGRELRALLPVDAKTPHR